MIVKNCKHAESFFALFVEDLLEEEERRAVQKHVQDCPQCLARLATAQQALLLLKRLQEEDVILPDDFQARLMQRIMAGELAADALDFSWQGLITILLQFLEALFSMLSTPQPQAIGQPA